MSDDETSTHATEQTPLLRDAPADDQDQPQNHAQVPLRKEATTKEMIVILGAIWMGVFLAALGTRRSLPNPLPFTERPWPKAFYLVHRAHRTDSCPAFFN